MSLDKIGEICQDSTNLISVLSLPTNTQNDLLSSSEPQDPVSFSQTQPIIPVTIEGSDEEVLDALMDTGATECYMVGRVLSEFADVTQAHDKPIELQLFDGKPSSSGPLTFHLCSRPVKNHFLQDSILLNYRAPTLY